MRQLDEKALRKFMIENKGIQYTSYKVKDSNLNKEYFIPHIFIHETNIFLIFSDVVSELEDVIMPSMHFKQNVIGDISISPLAIIYNENKDNELIFLENRARRQDTRTVTDIMSALIKDSNNKITEQEKFTIKRNSNKVEQDNIVIPEDAILGKRNGENIFFLKDEEKNEEMFEYSYYWGFLGLFWFSQKGFKNKLIGLSALLTFGFYGMSILKGIALYLGLVKDSETGYYYLPNRRGIKGKLWMATYGILTVIFSWRYYIPIQIWLLDAINTIIAFVVNIF